MLQIYFTIEGLFGPCREIRKFFPLEYKCLASEKVALIIVSLAAYIPHISFPVPSTVYRGIYLPRVCIDSEASRLL